MLLLAHFKTQILTSLSITFLEKTFKAKPIAYKYTFYLSCEQTPMISFTAKDTLKTRG